MITGVEKEVVVHRKGATPAGQGVLGIIPGSMASPGFVVSGKGNAESLNSASHGAGRVMSRKAANEKLNWKDANRFLRQQGVTLISAGLDEVPMVYKNIHEVMAAQRDLVTILGQFDPKLVKMAPAGERPEDKCEMKSAESRMPTGMIYGEVGWDDSHSGSEARLRYFLLVTTTSVATPTPPRPARGTRPPGRTSSRVRAGA